MAGNIGLCAPAGVAGDRRVHRCCSGMQQLPGQRRRIGAQGAARFATRHPLARHTRSRNAGGLSVGWCPRSRLGISRLAALKTTAGTRASTSSRAIRRLLPRLPPTKCTISSLSPSCSWVAVHCPRETMSPLCSIAMRSPLSVSDSTSCCSVAAGARSANSRVTPLISSVNLWERVSPANWVSRSLASVHGDGPHRQTSAGFAPTTIAAPAGPGRFRGCAASAVQWQPHLPRAATRSKLRKTSGPQDIQSHGKARPAHDPAPAQSGAAPAAPPALCAAPAQARVLRWSQDAAGPLRPAKKNGCSSGAASANATKS